MRVTVIRTLLAGWLVTITAGCVEQAARDVSWPLKQGDTISCENYATSVVNAGDENASIRGILTNNVWNYKAAETAWSQCLLSREIDGQTQYGWAWSWPEQENTIFAQPQIKVGASPWQPSPSMYDQFPAKIGDLTTLRLAFDVDTKSTGNFNLAATMWVTREGIRGDEAKPNLIETEVMVWPFATPGQSRPGGRRIDVITINDKNWEVWHEKNWVDVSGENQNKWSFLAFRAKQNSLKGDIDLRALLNYATSKGLLDENHFVADLELGNEVMSGQGSTWVSQFDVQIETQ